MEEPKRFYVSASPFPGFATYRIRIRSDVLTREKLMELGFKWDPEAVMDGAGHIEGRWEWCTTEVASEETDQAAAKSCGAMWDKLVALGLEPRGGKGALAALSVRKMFLKEKPA